MTQAERYDPEGEYVRKWVSEVAGFANHSIHDPWLQSKRNPQPAPAPIVDLGESRSGALEAHAHMRRRAKP